MADVLELKGENPFRIRAYRRATQNRDGRAFLDKHSSCVEWMNCSIVTATMSMQMSSNHETLTQEPRIEVQGPGCPGSATGRCHAGRTWITPRRTRHPNRRLAHAGA
ncbi:MAG: helix-hairpin-helix domain-containing protein [Candidatus Rokubacteria bacterium]|nr:helix-hairpin-helix domain-containing protein [Candidatus Rokubacteria bacterium]